jgi:hypothetical protein
MQHLYVLFGLVFAFAVSTLAQTPNKCSDLSKL